MATNDFNISVGPGGSSENGGGGETSKLLCRYYLNGACQKGSRCQFSHDRNDRPSQVCRFYLRGGCSYGAQCRYDHVKPSNRSQETGQQHQRPPSTNISIKQSPPNSVSSPPVVAAAWPSSRSDVQSGSTDDDNNDYELGLVSLKDMATKSTVAKNSKLRADAKEFVPSSFGLKNGFSPPSYAHAVSGSSVPLDEVQVFPTVSKDLLCPYYIMGECPQGDECLFMHGDICDLCNRPVLHPEDQVFNAEHRKECMAEHEREMELAFAVAKGEGKQCGICMEVVMEKTVVTSRRFGVLPSCKHCFCLECIRKWRRAEQFENKVVRACPECRTLSDFVVPSTIWVEEDDEKKALLDAYHSSMKQKTCKYFREGQVECPFGNKCFYRHVKPDGTLVEGDSPRAIRRRQQRQQQRGRNGAGSSTQLFLLWDFFEEQDWYRSGRHSSDSDDDDDYDDDFLLEFRIEQALGRLHLNGDDSDYDYE